MDNNSLIAYRKPGGKVNIIEKFKNGRQIRKMQTASGGPIYEEDWSDKLEPYAAGIGLAGDAIGVGAAATGIGVPSGITIAGITNIPNLLIDGYQAGRDFYRTYKDKGKSIGSALWNTGEFVLDAAGLKALQYINKAAKAGVASEKYLTSTEKALDSKPWKRVGTGHGRVRARQSANHKRKYNFHRNKALEESNIELAKRGVRPALGLYYQQKLTDEMAKRGYGVTVNDAIRSANRTVRLNLGTISGVSGGTNIYHIFKKDNGGMLELLKKGSKIHIKEKNKGTFTKWCGGNVTDECILRGKNSSNPKIRKRATFADNARHFKHRLGGSIVEANQLYELIQENKKDRLKLLANARNWKHKKGGVIKAQEGTKFNWGELVKTVGGIASNAMSTVSENKKLSALAKQNKLEKINPLDYITKYLLEILESNLRSRQAARALGSTVNFNPDIDKHFAYLLANQEVARKNNEIDKQNKLLDVQTENLKTSNWMNLFGNVALTGLGYLTSNIGKKSTNVNVPPSSTSTTANTVTTSNFDNYMNNIAIQKQLGIV